MQLTIFTPTYNRKYIIDSLYQSLLTQTSFDFEWVVVDDGSTDGTSEYFDLIINNNNPFDIVYKKVNNGGKHRAINEGVKIATGKYFFIVDSDDYLIENAVELILSWFSNLPKDKQFAGVAGNRGYDLEHVIGDYPADKEYVDAKNNERRKKHLLGDKAEIFYTDVLKKYPFPSFEGENFLLESVVWNKIAYDGYYMRWFNKIIYITEYLEDGLTQNVNEKYENNLFGLAHWVKCEVKYNKSLTNKLSPIFRYYEYSNKTIREIHKTLNISYCLILLSVLLGKIKRMVK